ncbi:hypothetical protein SDC9_120513 [bioreactor metagenome]|uniref:Uncharacterized protein n=1 Tax=bioreactor metagenome TaxID=1076179 RepID=A0A645C8A8_9ZZZZ
MEEQSHFHVRDHDFHDAVEPLRRFFEDHHRFFTVCIAQTEDRMTDCFRYCFGSTGRRFFQPSKRQDDFIAEPRSRAVQAVDLLDRFPCPHAAVEDAQRQCPEYIAQAGQMPTEDVAFFFDMEEFMIDVLYEIIARSDCHEVEQVHDVLHEHREETAQMDFVHQVSHTITGTDRNHEPLIRALVFVLLSAFNRSNDIGGRCVSRLFGGLHDLRHRRIVFIRLFVVDQVPRQVNTIGIFRFHVFIGYQTTRSCLLDAVSCCIRVRFYPCRPNQRVCRNDSSIRQLDAVLLDVCDPIAFDDLDAFFQHVFFGFLLFLFGNDT